MRTRLDALDDINETFVQYCHACPYQGKNTACNTCHRCPIRGKLRDYGRELGWDDSKTNGPPPWSPEEVATLKELYLSGVTYKDIGKQLGKTEACVSNMAYKMRTKGELPKREQPRPKTKRSGE